MTKNNKYDTTVTLLGILTATLLLIPMLAQTPLQSAVAQANQAPSTSDDCLDKAENEMHSKASTLDNTKAITLAVQDSQFKSKIYGYSSTFNSIFNTWTIDTTTCTASWNDVNVVHTLSNATAQVKNVVVTLDPELTKIIRVTEHAVKQNGHLLPVKRNANWSGYEFSGDSQASVNVYEAQATWYVPSVSEPWAYACFFTHCDLSIWPGLEDVLGAGNNHLVQAGSNSGVYCTGGCSYFYELWYEFVGEGNVTCPTAVSPSHSIRTTVINKAKTGGNPWLYDITITNQSTNQSCTVTNHSYTSMQSPKYGTFINERPNWNCCGLARLPQFSSDTMTGWVWYSGSTKTIYTPWLNNWGRLDIMNNNQGDNISVGSVNSVGTFTQTWLTSNGT